RGDPIPTGLDIVLLAYGLPVDMALHTALSPLVATTSMTSLTTEAIARAIETARVPIDHPINELILDPESDAVLEDAALGGERGRSALLRRRSGRNVSAADLARARRNADQIGIAGEGLINAWLNQHKIDGILLAYEWSSAANAVCP